ncbi:chloroplast protein FOR GROWTH AND FERTILITY 2-like [Henckelia pumila]|uniref:chloroplast protein FOR GROWTH AND FERTILITY 2-like n=1 Tax=Henckelia pumila TaxID=405737 RepID=UPI003C6E128D
MERLIHPKACNLKPGPHPLVPRFAGVVSARKMAFSSASFRWAPLRVKSLSCGLQDPSLVSPETREEVSFSVDSTDGLAPKPHFRRLIPLICSSQRKVVKAGAVILLSAILLTVLHPVVVSPAFASFPNAAKTGIPAAVAAGTSLIRVELLSSAWTGFLAGCLHTLSGPDHLAALAPLSIGCSRMESAAVGALWGCGHDAGQLIFGLLFLLLKDRLHIEVLRTWGTRVVGFTLLVIGAMGIREALEVPAPCVVLENGESDVSGYEMIAASPSIGKKKFGFTTFATGIVHGLQPDALIVILPALALPSRLAGAAFLFMFLVGTVFAMGSYTMFIGSCSQALKERIPRVTEKLTWASSLVAIGLGVAILISEFFGLSLY